MLIRLRALNVVRCMTASARIDMCMIAAALDITGRSSR